MKGSAASRNGAGKLVGARLRAVALVLTGLAILVGAPTVLGASSASSATLSTDWTSFIDLYGTGSGTAANALTITPPNGTTCSAPCDPFPTTDTFTLKNFATGADLTGMQVQVDASVNVVSTNGASSTAGDAATVFSGINGAGVYSFDNAAGRKFDLNLTGLDNTKTYTITLSANRAATTGANSVRWSKFTLDGAAAGFTNASSTGTLSSGDGSQVWFNTGNNGTNGYVAKWTGITTGGDGAFSVRTSYIIAPSGTTDTSSYAPSLVKLEQSSSGPSVPGAPTGVTATRDDGSANVSWTAPASDGGSSITGYQVTPYIGATAQTPTAVGVTTSTTVSGLTNGTAYTFKVAAINSVGTGPDSTASNSVTPQPSISNWTAYADLRDPHDSNTNTLKITAAGADPFINAATSFVLPDFATGFDTDARLQVDNSGINTSSAGDGGTTGNFTGGEGLAVFGGKVNGTGVYSFQDGGDVFRLNFSGLDPAKRYTVVLSSNRNDTTAGERWCDLDLLDVSSAAEASGGTTTVVSPTHVRFLARQNTSRGDVARWTNIDPGGDGDFSVQANLFLGGGITPAPDRSYAPVLVMLQEMVPSTVPGTPTGVSATAGDGSAHLSWTAPGDGGSPITDYIVTPYEGATAGTPQNVGTGTSATIFGLTNGTEYTFKVAAANANGTGPDSAASNAVTPQPPITVPGAPTGATATAGDGSAGVSWTAPSSNGGSAITGYVVTPYDGATAGTPVPVGVVTSTTVTGLTNGTAYTFKVAAVNSIGTGPDSAASNSVTPQAPVTLVSIAVTPTTASVEVGATQQFTATGTYSDSSTADLSATATWSSDTPSVATVSSSGLATGVSAGSAVVTATSGLISDTASLEVTNPVTAPGAPTGATATAGDGSADVSWTAPASNGGSAITGYVVTPYDGATAGTPVPVGLVTSTTVTGLTNGTEYTFTVKAVTAAATGPESVASNVVTPHAPAGPGNAVGDLDGDGDTDIAVFRPSTGVFVIPGQTDVTLGESGDVPLTGDFDGNNTSEVAVYRPSTGDWLISGQATVQWGGQPGDVPVAGDYDGDGTTDIAIYRPSDGGWYVRGQASAPQWGGQVGDIPVPGDYDNDGDTDIAVYRSADHVWYVRGQGSHVAWGIDGDVPVAADYDGDGDTDIAMWRPTDGVWYVRQTSPGPWESWGVSGDIPVVGDYDGDGDADLAAYRPSEGVWYVKQAGEPWPTVGEAGDIPLVISPAVRLAYFG